MVTLCRKLLTGVLRFSVIYIRYKKKTTSDGAIDINVPEEDKQYDTLRRQKSCPNDYHEIFTKKVKPPALNDRLSNARK